MVFFFFFEKCCRICDFYNDFEGSASPKIYRLIRYRLVGVAATIFNNLNRISVDLRFVLKFNFRISGYFVFRNGEYLFTSLHRIYISRHGSVFR